MAPSWLYKTFPVFIHIYMYSICESQREKTSGLTCFRPLPLCDKRRARSAVKRSLLLLLFLKHIYIYICYSLSSPHISYSRMTILRYVAPVSDNTYKDDFIGLFLFLFCTIHSGKIGKWV